MADKRNKSTSTFTKLLWSGQFPFNTTQIVLIHLERASKCFIAKVVNSLLSVMTVVSQGSWLSLLQKHSSCIASLRKGHLCTVGRNLAAHVTILLAKPSPFSNLGTVVQAYSH